MSSGLKTLPRPTPEELRGALKREFGFADFRPGQLELIQAVLSGRDALGVLPTGGGKSLIYQLPALTMPGVTVVVSPLIALMKDQVDAFNRRGSRLAVALHSNQSADDARKALAQVHSGRAALLYVAPERFEFAGFREHILTLKPKLFVIDEAHCVNQWGYDFRPSYLALRDVVPTIRPAPVLALTATATPATRKEILARLELIKPFVFVGLFDRPNLRFEVHPCTTPEKMQYLRMILNAAREQGSHIVYVGRRKDADEIAAALTRAGFGAVPYHAGMEAQARRRAQEAWLSGEKPVAVATVAFGMGIDKPDVRTVVHYQHPASLEAYYQEAGRSGRDGAPARCITLYSTKDVSLAHFFLRNRYPSREQVLELYALVSPQGTSPDGLRLASGGLSDEQLNVALHALMEQRRVWRDEDGLLHRDPRDPAKAYISLSNLYARRSADYKRLEEVIRYCTDPDCHRTHLLSYFGESVPQTHRCGNCSACDGGSERLREAAALQEAETLLREHRSVFEADGPLDPVRYARFLGGSSSKKLPARWRKLRGFGSLQGLPMEGLQTIARRMLASESPVPATGGELKVPRVQPASDSEPKEGEPHEARYRSIAADELKKRKVARTTGIAILKLAAEANGALSPAEIARSLSSDKGYEENLSDVLAMWAKGYLSTSPESGKKLEITPLGRTTLGKA
ncbi:MAG TPA: ATP-dependent DNA helicase RecQ [Acidobacteriota bacterium]|nr:ATP-dependent DNA helicase RecQ [Acidobacteriota bacterium]